MLASWLADAVLVLHLLFIAFVVAGAALLWRWPRLAWLHLPAALWGAYAELSGTICPLTPLENRLRALAGEAGYAQGFVEHYLLALIYPAALTREAQLALGGAVLLLNLLLYALWLRSRRP
jgi:hypothetical protein